MIRTKILAVIILSIVLLCGLLYLVSSQLLIESYRDIETTTMERNLVRVQEAIRNQSGAINIKLRDWSQWDDTYRFIEDRNEEYVVSNLADETLINLELHYMGFFSRSGETVYAKQVDLEEGVAGSDINVTRGVLEHLRNQDGSLRLASSGIIELEEGLLLLEALPVIYSDGSGNPIGTLVFARFIDPMLVQSIADLTQLSVEIHPYLSSPADPVLSLVTDALRRDPYAIIPMDSSTIRGHFLLKNNTQKPIAIIQIETDRSIYLQGQRSVGAFILLSSISIIVFGVIILALLEILMLRRFKHFVQQVDTIDTQELSKAHIEDTGTNDEIGILATKINRLLSELAKAQDKERMTADLQKKTNAELTENLEELEKVNKLLVGRELKMIELKEEVENLRAKQ